MKSGTLTVLGLVVVLSVTPALAGGAASVLVGGGGATLAQDEGTVVGRPNVELSATDNRVGAGERVTLEVFASNTGDVDRGGPEQYEQRVTTARNVRLSVDEDRMNGTLRRGVDVRTGEVFAGSVPEGVSGPFSFDLEVNDSLPPGTYRIPVEVTYDYTNFVRYGPNAQPEYGDGSRSQTAFVTLVVEDRPQFDLRTTSLARVSAGDTTEYGFEVTNTGTQPATEVEVSLSAANSSVFFGGSDAPQQRTSVFLGRVDANETRSFAVRVGATDDTAPGTYLADAVIAYENPSGVSDRSDRLPFGVAVGGEQTFELGNVDGNLTVGDTGVVAGRVVNTGGSNVTDATVVLRGSNPSFQPRETEYAVGDLAPGESANFSFRVDTSNATDPGPRPLQFAVRYRDAEGDNRTSDALDAVVAVAREQTFELRNATADVQVGDTGTVSGTVVNTGATTVSNAVVVFAGGNGSLRPRETEYAVGDLAPGESAEFSFTVEVANDSDPGQRQVPFRVRYRNAADDRRTSDALDAVVAVAPEQAFAVENVSGTLQAGRTGDLRGELTNAGDRRVSNAVVVLRTNNPNLQPRETEYAVGDLAPGESVPFEFAVDVNSQAEPGPRQVSFGVRYRNRDGDLRASDRIDARVTVAEDDDEFRVEPVNTTVDAGASTVVTFRITNTADETVRDVATKLFADDPLSSDNDEAFVPRLDPGESTILKFGLSADGGAIQKVYPVSMDFSYENERGEGVLSDTYRVPVTVTEPPRRTFGVPGNVPAVGVAAVAATVVVLGLVWWKRDAVGRLFGR